MTEKKIISVGEQKFLGMVSDLMTMAETGKPQMVVACPSMSKARSLRRMFYNWRNNLAERERSFMNTLEFKLTGRSISIYRKDDWQPVETTGESNVSASQGEPA